MRRLCESSLAGGPIGNAPVYARIVPRPNRPQVAGGIYHITARGNRRQDVFADDSDRDLYLSLLERVVVRYGWRCHGYCLMANHVHLVIETPQPNISFGMQFLSGRYAQIFNQRHGVTGHLFQGRFHSVLVQHTSQLLVLMRYVALNPVEAHLCDHPRDWKWSSYAAVVGRTPKPQFLQVDLIMESLGQNTREGARAAFAEFVVGPPARAGP